MKIKSQIIAIGILLLVAGCESDRQVNSPVPVVYQADINLNGKYNEIADMVLYSNYFVYGSSVFSIDFDRQVAASDVNKDGNVLTVADLVYLSRLINSDTILPPKLDTLKFLFHHDYRIAIKLAGDVEIGGVHVVTKGQATPRLLNTNMEMLYTYNGINTKVLVWSRYGKSFNGDILDLSGPLISIEVASWEGQPIQAVDEFPDSVYLSQNDPNPFIKHTFIRFFLGERCEADLVIKNQNGKAVFKLSRTFNVGMNSVGWFALDPEGEVLPAGTYYCTLEALGRKSTIVMTLL